MPELPEVEVLVRHLDPLVRNKRISSVEVRRERVLRPTTVSQLQRALRGAVFQSVTRRGKYLLFEMRRGRQHQHLILLGHLGMTGRMFVLPKSSALPKHAAVVLGLGKELFVFEDTRYFGRLTLDTSAVQGLGPEPLSPDFSVEVLKRGLARSRQPVKVKLLDQKLVAGIGNIYASESLFRAGISPRVPACRLNDQKIERLWQSIRETLTEAIEFGSTVPLKFGGVAQPKDLFYYGTTAENPDAYEERLRVYDRHKQPCVECGSKIKRIVQAARSSFFCPKCQRAN